MHFIFMFLFRQLSFFLMKNHTLLLLTLLFALGLRGSAWATMPPLAGSAAAGPSLAGALNADGTLRAGASGSFDAKGYELVEVAGSRQPQFRPVRARRVQGVGDEKWQDGFVGCRVRMVT